MTANRRNETEPESNPIAPPCLHRGKLRTHGAAHRRSLRGADSSDATKNTKPDVATSTGFAHVMHNQMGESERLMHKLLSIQLFAPALTVLIFLAPARAEDVPATKPTSKSATAPSATQTSITGAKSTFPDATPEVVT